MPHDQVIGQPTEWKPALRVEEAWTNSCAAVWLTRPRETQATPIRGGNPYRFGPKDSPTFGQSEPGPPSYLLIIKSKNKITSGST